MVEAYDETSSAVLAHLVTCMVAIHKHPYHGSLSQELWVFGALCSMASTALAEKSDQSHSTKDESLMSGSTGLKTGLELLCAFRNKTHVVLSTGCPSQGITGYDDNVENLVQISICQSNQLHVKLNLRGL